jgi:hypothetical protein
MLKCPLRLTKTDWVSNNKWLVAEDCLQAECAWWIPAFEVCSIKEIAIREGSIADDLFKLWDNLTEGGKK